MTFSHLDLVALGNRAFPKRINTAERVIKKLVLTGVDVTPANPGLARANEVTNSSFEYFDKNSTKPADWTVTGSASLEAAPAGGDGSYVMALQSGSSISQVIQSGISLPAGAVVLSCLVKTTGAGTVSLSVSGGTTGNGPVYRVDPDNNEAEGGTLPDTRWFLVYRQYQVNSSPNTISIGYTGTGKLYVDAVKLERAVGATGLVSPTEYATGDYGAAVHIRNLSADNLTAGTLTVGGSGSANPRITVLNGDDVEMITIGDPNSGFYGIDIFEGGGLRLRDGGDIQIQNGGILQAGTPGGQRLEVSSLGLTGYNEYDVPQVTIATSDGRMRVLGSGAVSVEGGGSIRAGTPGGQRLEISSSGLTGYNVYDEPQVTIATADGRMRVLGPGAVSVEGGGSILAGDPSGARLQLSDDGLEAFNTANVRTVSISTLDGIVRVDADAFIVDGTVGFDNLAVTGEVTVGQDLRVGSNVLFVDESQGGVGINKAPDPQFDLDVNGNARVGGYIVGKHALQIKDATMIAHFDGAEPIGTNTTGDPTGHRGQVAVTTAVTYTQGKFQKGVQIGSGGQLNYAVAGTLFPSAGTIALWFNAPTSGAGAKRRIFTLGTQLYIEQTAAGKLAVGVDGAGTDVIDMPLDVWTHIAVAWDAAKVYVYIDGTLEKEITFSGYTSFSDTRFWIGTNNTAGIDRFTGVIDDLLITKTTLAASLIRSIVESDAPVFAETSNWAWRSANSLAWADSEGLWAINSSGQAAFGVAGVDGKSWGGQTLDRGDVLIGRGTQYALWDDSTGTFTFRGNGSGLTSINGANITTGTITADKLNVSSLSAITADLGTVTAGTITGVLIRTAASGARVELQGSNNRLIMFNAAGAETLRLTGDGLIAGNVTVNASEGITVTGDGYMRFNWPSTSHYAHLDAFSGPIAAPSDNAIAPFLILTQSGASGYHPIIIGANHNRSGTARVIIGGDITEGNIPDFTAETVIRAEANTYKLFHAGTSHAVKVIIGSFGQAASSGLEIRAGRQGGNVTANSYIQFASGSDASTVNTASIVREPTVNGNWHFYNEGTGDIRLTANHANGGIDLRANGVSQLRTDKDGVWIDRHNQNTGSATTPVFGIRFGSSGQEGMASQQVGAGGNPQGLDFFTRYAKRMWITSAGAAWISGSSWNYSSDERLKENIEDLPYGLDEIDDLAQAVAKFDYINGEKSQFGFIAQRLQAIAPDLVTENGDGYLGVKVNGIIPILVKALSELKERVQQLEG